MNRQELKDMILQRKLRIYNHDYYQNLSDHFLYNPDYKKKDPRQYIFLHSRARNTLQPIRISKSISIFLEQEILYKMDQVARQLNYIVVPAAIFHWRRRQKLRDVFPSFVAGVLTYIMLPEEKLNTAERHKFIDHIRTLDWHDNVVY